MALICPGERRVHRSSDRGCYLSSAHSGLYTVVKIESGLWWSSFVGGWSERNPQKVILRRGSSHYFSSFLLCQLRLCTLPRSVCVCVWQVQRGTESFHLTHTHTKWGLRFPVTFSWNITSQKDWVKAVYFFASVLVRGALKPQRVPRCTWWPPCITMRRAFSVFRGYRRAGEDDDDVFVCSSGHKVTQMRLLDIFTMSACLDLCPLH